MLRLITSTFLGLTLALLITGLAGAAEWGNLSGTIVHGGKTSAPAKIVISADKAFCGKHNLVDESIVVGKDGGLKNVVVFVYLKRGETIDVHPSYEKLAEEPVKFNNKNCRFEPRMALLWNKQKLLLGNEDSIAHNTKIDTFSNPPLNPIIPAGATFEQDFQLSERLPARVSCSIHPWMIGWLVVKDNPYFAVTDENGNFEIKNLPAGEWTFQFWHESTGYLSDVTIAGKDPGWERGRATVKIEADKTTSLGKATVAPTAFK